MNDLDATRNSPHNATSSVPRPVDQRPVHDDARFWYRICGIERGLRLEVEAELKAERQRPRNVHAGFKLAAAFVLGILGGNTLLGKPPENLGSTQKINLDKGSRPKVSSRAVSSDLAAVRRNLVPVFGPTVSDNASSHFVKQQTKTKNNSARDLEGPN